MKKFQKTDINIVCKGGRILRDIVKKDSRENLEKKHKKMNKKKLAISISIGIILVIIALTAILYYSSRDVRQFLDQYLFRKNITQEKLNSIPLDYDSNINVFAYNKNICILAENKLMKYNTSGNLEDEINLEINNPVYSVNNKYLAISEKNSSTLYLISGSEILWTKDVDGNISKINVNENGYVSAILTGTSYKSVITTFDNKGNELFKTYRATTTVIDTSISSDNKNLAFAEVDTTGTTIQSYVRVLPIQNPSEKNIYTFSADSNKLIVDIVYHNNNQIICMYDSEITELKDKNNTVLLNLNESGKNINFSNINLKNFIYRAVEENDGLFNTNTVIEMKSTSSDKTVIYTVQGAAKDVNSFGDVIAINLGQEVEFINTRGGLLKRYSSLQEVQDVILGNGVAGIVYNDKVELINL